MAIPDQPRAAFALDRGVRNIGNHGPIRLLGKTTTGPRRDHLLPGGAPNKDGGGPTRGAGHDGLGWRQEPGARHHDQSAATTETWRDFRIKISIARDTWTLRVEESGSIRVLERPIRHVVDAGRAASSPRSEKVWRQPRRYGVPAPSPS